MFTHQKLHRWVSCLVLLLLYTVMAIPPKRPFFYTSLALSLSLSFSWSIPLSLSGRRIETVEERWASFFFFFFLSSFYCRSTVANDTKTVRQLRRCQQQQHKPIIMANSLSMVVVNVNDYERLLLLPLKVEVRWGWWSGVSPKPSHFPSAGVPRTRWETPVISAALCVPVRSYWLLICVQSSSTGMVLLLVALKKANFTAHQ